MSEELEWKTRRDRINKKLRALNPNWEIIKYKEGLDLSKLTNHAVEEYPTENGPADYALFVDGKLLGIIEAKKVRVSPQNVLEQAKRYSKGVRDGIGNWNGYGVPFLYSSNGEVVWFMDVRNENNYSRQISGFHTPPALKEYSNRECDCRKLLELSITNPRLRYYQTEAIQKIENKIYSGKRIMLVAMATGTGKTFMTVSLIYRLLESKLFKRILFLVDRRALAAQATREFSAFTTPHGNKLDQEYEVYSQRFQKEDFDEDSKFNPKVLPNEYLTSPDANKTFIYVSTIQRMTVNLFGWDRSFEQNESDPDYEADAEKINIPNHAFDLIIADECHRGYTARQDAVWRETLNYFDAIKIGLTATPAAHSLSLFEEVIYRYNTEQGILDGFLSDYEPVKINSNILMNGVFLKEGELVGSVDTETGVEVLDRLEDERVYASTEIERDITSPDTNRKIIKEIAKYAYDHEKETNRFPKILIFAVNDIPHISHADQLVKICREEFAQGDKFVQKITGSPSVDRPLQKIREFRNRPEPKIVVTVDMLSTGVDIPSLEFIVFLRPVKSRILWVQMLGRGTRRCDEINKDHFKIFDCFNGTLIEYFKNTTDFNIEIKEKENVTLAQVIENIYQNVDREYYTKVLIKRLRRIEKNMSGKAREMFAEFIEDGDLRKYTNDLSENLKENFTEAMALLRNKKFQDLLINYPRAKHVFYKGYEIQDEVVSETMFDNHYTKPEDYLDSFEKFVKDNEDKIEAIKILTSKPKGWNLKALEELTKQLNGKNYPLKKLQRAHQLVYHKELADLISMVKHAANEKETILNAEERVNKAFERILEGKSFSEEQNKWLEFIKNHMISKLTLEMNDFNESFIFSDHGGLGKVKKVFGNELEEIVKHINYEVAA